MRSERDFQRLERQNARLKRELAKVMKQTASLAGAIESTQLKAERIRGNARAAINRAEEGTNTEENT